MTSHITIQRTVTRNLESRTLSEQLNAQFHLTALYLAEIAYFKLDTMQRKLEELGAYKISIYNYNGTQGYLAEFNDVVVVGFRGTQLSEWYDLKTVLTFWRIEFLGIKVHKGFYNSLNGILEKIESEISQIKETKRTVYVGHSMGGALATLLSTVHKPTDLCTFGEPRISGGKEFESLLEQINYQRIVTKHDWIRLLPPKIPGVLPYTHHGRERILDTSWSWKSWLKPHRLSTYLKAIVREDIEN